MYADLLNYAVEKKVYAIISGLTQEGTELTLVKSKNTVDVYIQNEVIFTSHMVKNIIFHEHGCTITLKH